MKPPWTWQSSLCGVTMLRYLFVLCIGLQLQVLCLASKEITEEFACFNTIFEISCHSNEVIVFDTARYGRNDTIVATRCQVPYQRTCDVDVHFPLNRVCAGKQKCSLAVNTALFGDPCGYEEFLRVKYRCVAVATVQQMCFGPNGPTFYDHGFLASPNYPAKYFMDAECHWKISVQKRQRITVTVLDFELDVKKGGQCNDYLEISAGERVYFNDCGSLGKQVIQVDSSKSLVRFHTGVASLAQRGFLIYFEALGPGCPDLEDLDHAWADYYIDQDVLYANVSCQEGFHFSGTDTKHQLIQCSGSHWDTELTACIASTPPTTPIIIVTSPVNRNNTSAIDDSGSLIGIALGVVSAILLITLLLVLALYFHKRRRNAERKLDQWRFVINNLQENSINEENHKRATLEGSGINVMATPVSNVRKAGKRTNKKNKKINNKEDELQGRNLLTSPNYDEDDLHEIMMLSPRDVETMMKYPMPNPDEEAMRQKSLSRKNSKIGKYSLARSRDSELENSIWMDCDGRDKPRSKRDLRYKRAKSGQWDAPMNKSFGVPTAIPVYPAPGQLKRKHFTQSAPDLVMLPETCAPSVGNGDIFCCHTDVPVYGHPDNSKLNRPSTMVAVPSNRLNKPAVPPRTSSRGKIRC